jgi:hypothetical protein
MEIALNNIVTRVTAQPRRVEAVSWFETPGISRAAESATNNSRNGATRHGGKLQSDRQYVVIDTVGGHRYLDLVI